MKAPCFNPLNAPFPTFRPFKDPFDNEEEKHQMLIMLLSRKLTWNPRINRWKTISLYNPMVLGFHIKLHLYRFTSDKCSVQSHVGHSRIYPWAAPTACASCVIVGKTPWSSQRPGGGSDGLMVLLEVLYKTKHMSIFYLIY